MYLQLAQAQQSSAFLDLIERVARSSYETIVWFALVCTVIHVGLHFYVEAQSPETRLMMGPRAAGFFRGLAESLVYASIIVFFVIRPFGIQTFRIPSESMLDTLKGGSNYTDDILLVNKLVYRTPWWEPKAGDIVVFKPPEQALDPWQDRRTDFVKRLIGTPGQLVEIENSMLKRDGKETPEPYVKDEEIGDFKLVKYNGRLISLMRNRSGVTNPMPSSYPIPFADEDEVWALPAEPIPDGHYLMLGDNRNYSRDGRYWGLIKRDQIVGRAFIIVYPPSRWGRPN